MHTIDRTHAARVGRAIVASGGWGTYGCEALLVAAAHAAEARVVLVVSTDGRLFVASGGHPEGPCGVCGSRAPSELTAGRTRAHVDHLAAIDIHAREDGAVKATMSFATSAQPPIELILTAVAADDLVQHVLSLRSLSRGVPAAGVPLSVTSNRAANVVFAPSLPHSVHAGLLAGLVVNLAGVGESLGADAAR